MIKYYSYKNKNDLLNCKEFIFNLINDGNIVCNFVMNKYIKKANNYRFNYFIPLQENIDNYLNATAVTGVSGLRDLISNKEIVIIESFFYDIITIIYADVK